MTAFASALGPSAYWYLTRATGVVSLLLLTAIIVLGVLGPMRVSAGPRWPRFAIDSVHRDLSLLAIAFIVIHVITSVLDGFAPIGLIDAVIPFHSAYRPLWLGLGAVAFDLILALVITSLVRRRLGHRTWRLVHWLAYASWPVAVLHGLGTGSDSKQAWALLVTFACVLTVAAAVVARIARAAGVSDGWRTISTGATVITPVALAGFTLLGPLAPHWSARAGTPASLLGAHTFAAKVTTPVTTTRATAKVKLPFTAQLDGTMQQTQAAGGAIVDLEMRLSGGLTGQLRIRLGGQPEGGGLSMTGSQVDLIASGVPVAFEGRVTGLDGDRVVARVQASLQTPMLLTANLQINNQTVTGTLQGQAAR